MSDSLDAYLILSGLLFAIGSFGFLARRNAISMLMSIELMLNGVNLAIVAFGAFGARRGHGADVAAAQGSVIALMVMAVAAAEATVGLAIVIAIYRNKKTPSGRRIRRDEAVSDLRSLDPAARRCCRWRGSLLTAVIGRRLGKQAHWIPVLAIFAVWVIAMGLVVQVLTGAAPLLPGSEDSHGYVVDWFTWIPAGDFHGRRRLRRRQR